MAAIPVLYNPESYGGVAAGSNGTFTQQVAKILPGKQYAVRVFVLANDAVGNNVFMIEVVQCVRNNAGAAQLRGGIQTSVPAVIDVSYGGSGITFTVAGDAVSAVFTNAGTNAADVGFWVTVNEMT
jgi:hypothetical protein